jgi:hypothetical protein
MLDRVAIRLRSRKLGDPGGFGACSFRTADDRFRETKSVEGHEPDCLFD